MYDSSSLGDSPNAVICTAADPFRTRTMSSDLPWIVTRYACDSSPRLGKDKASTVAVCPSLVNEVHEVASARRCSSPRSDVLSTLRSALWARRAPRLLPALFAARGTGDAIRLLVEGFSANDWHQAVSASYVVARDRRAVLLCVAACRHRLVAWCEASTRVRSSSAASAHSTSETPVLVMRQRADRSGYRRGE